MNVSVKVSDILHVISASPSAFFLTVESLCNHEDKYRYLPVFTDASCIVCLTIVSTLRDAPLTCL